MQKIVVGIIAVFFVQIAFQVYSAIDRTNDDFKAVATTSPLNATISPEIAAVPDLDTSYAFSTVRGPEPQRVSTRENTRQQRVRANAVQRNSRSAGRFSGATVARSAPRLPDATVPQRVEFTTVSTSASIRPEKKRSFFSKVIRKPYDWIKTAVSKL